jgi:hypothetical protein
VGCTCERQVSSVTLGHQLHPLQSDHLRGVFSLPKSHSASYCMALAKASHGHRTDAADRSTLHAAPSKPFRHCRWLLRRTEQVPLQRRPGSSDRSALPFRAPAIGVTRKRASVSPRRPVRAKNALAATGEAHHSVCYEPMVATMRRTLLAVLLLAPGIAGCAMAQPAPNTGEGQLTPSPPASLLPPAGGASVPLTPPLPTLVDII